MELEKGKGEKGRTEKRKGQNFTLKNKIKTWLKRNTYYRHLGAENVLSVKM